MAKAKAANYRSGGRSDTSSSMWVAPAGGFACCPVPFIEPRPSWVVGNARAGNRVQVERA
jgi:hypothetical protein